MGKFHAGKGVGLPVHVLGLPEPLAWIRIVPRFLLKHRPMTIETISDKIIKDIKAFPEEARQSQESSGPLTSWDEYKEQMQYEEYDSFDVFQETIRSMAEAKIAELSDVEIGIIYHKHYSGRFPVNADQLRESVSSCVLSYIEDVACSEEIEYRKPEIEFIRYFEYDLMIVAKVLRQVGPCDYIIHAYSEATSPDGEQGQVDITTLDEENAIERISEEEFERERWILTELNKADEELTEIQRAIKKIDFRLQQSWVHKKPDKNKIDPELLQSGITLAMYHIKAGARRFDEYVKAMVKDLGYSIKPYLKCFYEALRDWPDFDAAGMDSHKKVDISNVDEILTNPYNRLLEIAKDKIKILYGYHDPSDPVFTTLMLAVFNFDNPGDLPLNMEDETEMLHIVNKLQDYKDQAVLKWLGLEDEIRLRQITEDLEEAQTEDDLRDVLIMDLMFEAMRDNFDWFHQPCR